MRMVAGVKPGTERTVPGLQEAAAGKNYAKRQATLRRSRICPALIWPVTHLLRGGVDINTVRDWLGHVSVDTTNIYARVDLETKAKAIAHCEPEPTKPAKHWSEDKGLMTFLRSL